MYFSVTERALMPQPLAQIESWNLTRKSSTGKTKCKFSAYSMYTIQNVLIIPFEIHTPPWKVYKHLSGHTTTHLFFLCNTFLRPCISMDDFVKNLYWICTVSVLCLTKRLQMSESSWSELHCSESKRMTGSKSLWQ